MIAAVAGAAAGIGDIAGFAGAADLANVASNLNTANAAVAAYTKGDYLGALSGALTATSGLTGTDFGLGGTWASRRPCLARFSAFRTRSRTETCSG